MKKRRSLTKKISKQREKIITFRIALILLVLTGLLCLVIWVTYLDNLWVSEIEVKGNKVIPSSLVTNEARQNLEGYTMLFFPKRSILTASLGSISNSVSDLSPRLKSVHTSRTGLDSIEIKLEEREPYALWCEVGIEKCYFMDKYGFIFDEASEFSTDLYPVYRGGLARGPIGEQFLTKDDFQNVDSFRKYINEGGVKLKEIDVKKSYFSAVLPSGGEILFEGGDPRELALNLFSVLESEELRSDGFSLENVDYVDLRYGAKVFWKPKSE